VLQLVNLINNIADELLFFCSGSKVFAMASNLKIIFDFDTYLAVDRI
jgi:hypothetical protein